MTTILFCTGALSFLLFVGALVVSRQGASNAPSPMIGRINVLHSSAFTAVVCFALVGLLWLLPLS